MWGLRLGRKIGKFKGVFLPIACDFAELLELFQCEPKPRQCLTRWRALGRHGQRAHDTTAGGGRMFT